MAGDRMSTVNGLMNLISNAMIVAGAALILIGGIGLLLTRTEDEEGGLNHDDADH